MCSLLNLVGAEGVLVVDDGVVCGFGVALDTGVGLEVEVEVESVRNEQEKT